MKIASLLAASILGCMPAYAQDLTISLTDTAGDPVANAVVMVSSDAASLQATSFEWPNTMAQEDIQFKPYVLIAPVGSEVSFPNRDRVRHHVYSFAKGNKFEIKLYGKDESRSVGFKATGIVAVGCNIHDGMIGYIRVVDTPYAAKTDASGRAVLSGLPGGAGEVTIWHPDMNSGEDMLRTYNLSTPNLDIQYADERPQHAHRH